MRNDKFSCAMARFLKMFRAKLLILMCMSTGCLLPAAAMAQAQDLLFTGEVFSQQAQEIFVPLTNNWQARISKLKPEGSKLEPGDIAVEFDGADVARQLEQQEEAQRTEQAKTERDLAKLDEELLMAGFALKQANVSRDLAVLKAAVPEGLIGSLEYSENQLAREKASKAVDDASEQLKDKRQSFIDRQRQADLDEKKASSQIELWNEMLTSFVVKATQPGFIIYGRHPWTRTKFEEGDTVQTSFRVAQIADTTDLAVKIWINSIDRPRVLANSAVNIMLDALPDAEINGQLKRISDSGQKRSEWGNGLYYEAIVVFDEKPQEELLPGMSVLVVPRP